ncbi:MFS transporter [Deinococcus sp. JMULE3]|uniref:MFS transporter n=1 Tax=Deinococcus sp. JMULE3 TaxID=2518341 RepID=UPI0035305109
MTALARAASAYPSGFWVLWWGTLINRLGEFVVPLLGFYLTAHAHLGVTQVSVILAMLGLGRFVSEGLSGPLTDRRGPAFTMILALTGGAVMILALSFAQGFWWTAAGVLGFSLLSALFKPAASTAVAELTQGPQRTRAYNLLYWAINVGAATAPLLGGWLAGRSLRLLFWLDAATMAAFALLLTLLYPRAPRAAPKGDARTRRLLPRDALLWQFCLASLLFGLTYQSYKLLAVVFAQQGYSAAQYGQVLAVNGGLVVLLGLPLGHLIARSGHPRWQALGAALLGAGFLGHALAHTLWAHMLAVAVWTVGEIIAYGISKTIISELGPPAQRGTYIGLVGSMAGLATLLAPLLGGALLQTLGAGRMWIVIAALALLAALLLLALEGRVRARLARNDPAG